MTFNFEVTNPGEEPLANVVVVDDNETPGDTSDDFNPTFVGGDDNNDGLLDLDEIWLYTAEHVVTAGLHTNIAEVTGDGDVSGQTVMADDPANHTGELAPTNVCESGQKPAVLTMRYNGEDEVLTNPQAGKASVDGDPGFDPVVYIVSSNQLDLNSKKIRIWFEGSVNLGATFDIDSNNAGRSKLDANTYVQVFASEGGILLQTIVFHTSCSKPLNIGDQFGSIVLEMFVGEGGAQIPAPLRAAGLLAEAKHDDANGLNRTSLQQAVASGIEYWRAAGVPAAQLDVLRQADVGIARVSGSLLGLAYPGNYILIDSDAAGYGWSNPLTASGGVDLNDTVAHEFGHLLGRDHDDRGGVMGASLTPRSIAGDAADSVFSASNVIGRRRIATTLNSHDASYKTLLSRDSRGARRSLVDSLSSATPLRGFLRKVDLAISEFSGAVSLDGQLLHSMPSDLVL